MHVWEQVPDAATLIPATEQRNLVTAVRFALPTPPDTAVTRPYSPLLWAMDENPHISNSIAAMPTPLVADAGEDSDYYDDDDIADAAEEEVTSRDSTESTDNAVHTTAAPLDREVEVAFGRRASTCVLVMNRGWCDGSGVQHMFLVTRDSDGQFMYPKSDKKWYDLDSLYQEFMMMENTKEACRSLGCSFHYFSA